MAMWGQKMDFNKNMKIKYVLLLFVLKCYINFEQNPIMISPYPIFEVNKLPHDEIF
jgi:hypothetical protein